MEFSFDRFYRMNRRAIIWLILFVLLYFLRDFLLLIFLTFIIGFFAFPPARFLMEKLRLSRGFAITLVYSAILVAYVATAWWVSPNLIEEAGKLNAQIPDIKLKLNELREEYSGKYPQLADLIESYIPADDRVGAIRTEDPEIRHMLEQILERLPDPAAPATAPEATPSAAGEEAADAGMAVAREVEPEADTVAAAEPQGPQAEPEDAPTPRELSDGERFIHDLEDDLLAYDPGASYIDREIDRWTAEIRRGLAASSARVVRFAIQSLMAILFSYLIMLDFGRLSKELSGLKSSKLRDFYEEAGQPVVQFAMAVAQGFKAIAIIAFITTIMLAVVMLVFRIPQVLLLSLVVFVTSLIPVVGVIFEVLAILLVTFNAYGLDYHFWAMVVGITIVHLVIAYVVAPIIFGRQFRLNMVLILIVLYIGQRVAGMWGLVLGVPVANYFIRDVFAVPFIEEKEATRKSRTIEIKADDAPTPRSPQT
jgi:predicted PurR-regulated permease PerM